MSTGSAVWLRVSIAVPDLRRQAPRFNAVAIQFQAFPTVVVIIFCTAIILIEAGDIVYFVCGTV
jgi:hypothetical protein